MSALDKLLTPKQQEFFRAKDKRLNFLCGSVRSGKTYISLLKFAIVVVGRSSPSATFLFCGKTLTTLKRNCLEPLIDLVGANNFEYSLNRKEGVLFGRRIFLEGATDATAEQKIRGMTLSGAYCDEITLYHKDFVSMLLTRLSMKGAVMYATCNPDAPTHYIKEDFIDKKDELDCAVWDFHLTDNTFLPGEYIEALKQEFTGVFYDRYILGLWVKAEGLIFPMYDEAIEETPAGKATSYCLSMDYGTQNAFAAILWGKYGEVWHAVSEYYYSGRDEGIPKTDEEYADEIERWLTGYFQKYKNIRGETERPPWPIKTIIDPSAASFIVLLQKKRSKEGMYRKMYGVIPADNAVAVGIQETASAMKTGAIKFSPTLKNWKKEVQGYVWDEKALEDRPVKIADHLQDASRYFVKTMHIMDRRRKAEVRI